MLDLIEVIKRSYKVKSHSKSSEVKVKNDHIPLVSERISKSSSFERKKNLGKKSRFSSR